jgi:Flp pilus assembly protein TadB
MSMSQSQGGPGSGFDLPNGPAAAAILAAGIGCAAVGILAFAGDATGALSGVTIVAIIIWLVSWFGLNRMWHAQTVQLARINQMAFGLLLVGFLLTFPPFMDLLQGK